MGALHINVLDKICGLCCMLKEGLIKLIKLKIANLMPKWCEIFDQVQNLKFWTWGLTCDQKGKCLWAGATSRVQSRRSVTVLWCLLTWLHYRRAGSVSEKPRQLGSFMILPLVFVPLLYNMSGLSTRPCGVPGLMVQVQEMGFFCFLLLFFYKCWGLNCFVFAGAPVRRSVSGESHPDSVDSVGGFISVVFFNLDPNQNLL